MINWDKYKDQIFELASRGYSSTQILKKVSESNPDEKFPIGADRQVRRLVSNLKQAKESFESFTEPKILLFDIETFPILAYTWTKWKANINDDFIVHDWGVLCWSAKWLFSDEVMNDTLTKTELANRDDRRISKSLWELIDEADVIIAHNLIRFDLKKMNTKFLEYGIGRPSPYQTIDTLLHVRKRFAITSNRLDYIAKNFFQIEGKLETEKGLWMKVMKDNDHEALLRMTDYCDQDVRVLQEVYLKIRAWVQPHPNVALLSMDINNGCPACGSEEKELTKTDYNTYVNSYTAYRCGGCGHIYRERKSKTPISSNAGLKVSTPK